MQKVNHMGIIAKQYNAGRIYLFDEITGKLYKIIPTYSILTDIEVEKLIEKEFTGFVDTGIEEEDL